MAFDLNKIKSLFVETRAETKTPTPEKLSQSAKNKPVQSSFDSASADTYDQTVFNSLLKAIEDHNLPGEDYLEFLSALQAMKNIQLDEKMKIQTVLVTLSTKGLTAKKIKESAEYYKKVLTEEQKQFYAELGEQTTRQVKLKEKEIAGLQETNKQKSDQIAALTKDINENQLKISGIQNALKEAETKIRLAEANFNKTFDYIIAQIDSNLTKIN
jgi:hypothetical protein